MNYNSWGMTLGELIGLLEDVPPEAVARPGFEGAHSYRGFYEDLAFEPTGETTAREMLKETKWALGQTFEGWKGGDYVMDKDVGVWISERGSAGGEPLTRMGLLARFCKPPDWWKP
jgi:hypothetical protein